VDMDPAARILLKALDGGVNFFDTARNYTDSEEKIGNALSGRRKEFYLATKSAKTDRDGLLSQLGTSLSLLKTDYLDLYQLHFVKEKPDPDDKEGALSALMELKNQGVVRHIGVTCHNVGVAHECLDLDVFDTLQFPLSYLSTPEELALAERCRDMDVGFIAMKAMAGGLIESGAAAYAFMATLPHVVPIYGVQKEEEIEEFLRCAKEGVRLNDELRAIIQKDRAEAAETFCRGCRYCLPCPADIPIDGANRMERFLKRSAIQSFMTDEWNEKMHRIDNCINCRACAERCPYGLDVPNLLRRNLEFFVSFREDYFKTHKSL